MEFKQIRYEKDPETGIVQISLNRPEIKNALENKGLNRAFGSSDFMETLTARMEKRDPSFTGA